MLPPCPVDKHGHGRDAADGDEDEGGEQHPGVVAHQPRHQHAADDGAEDAIDDEGVLVHGAADDDDCASSIVSYKPQRFKTVNERRQTTLNFKPLASADAASL